MSLTPPVPWIAQYAARKGLKYTPDADERWIRAWEPYTTVRTPLRYDHVLEATGEAGSLTIARFYVLTQMVASTGAMVEGEASAWIAIAQDLRSQARAAATSDVGRVFGESLDLVTMPRRPTGDAAFDHVFATFAPSDEDLGRAVTPSVRKLALSWQTPVHFELRPGGFILAPVALRADPDSLAWLVRAVHVFGEKAAKHPASDGARVR
jgi:hypothetical protein